MLCKKYRYRYIDVDTKINIALHTYREINAAIDMEINVNIDIDIGLDMNIDGHSPITRTGPPNTARLLKLCFIAGSRMDTDFGRWKCEAMQVEALLILRGGRITSVAWSSIDSTGSFLQYCDFVAEPSGAERRRGDLLMLAHVGKIVPPPLLRSSSSPSFQNNFETRGVLRNTGACPCSSHKYVYVVYVIIELTVSCTVLFCAVFPLHMVSYQI